VGCGGGETAISDDKNHQLSHIIVVCTNWCKLSLLPTVGARLSCMILTSCDEGKSEMWLKHWCTSVIAT